MVRELSIDGSIVNGNVTGQWRDSTDGDIVYFRQIQNRVIGYYNLGRENQKLGEYIGHIETVYSITVGDGWVELMKDMVKCHCRPMESAFRANGGSANKKMRSRMLVTDGFRMNCQHGSCEDDGDYQLGFTIWGDYK